MPPSAEEEGTAEAAQHMSAQKIITRYLKHCKHCRGKDCTRGLQELKEEYNHLLGAAESRNPQFQTCKGGSRPPEINVCFVGFLEQLSLRQLYLVYEPCYAHVCPGRLRRLCLPSFPSISPPPIPPPSSPSPSFVPSVFCTSYVVRTYSGLLLLEANSAVYNSSGSSPLSPLRNPSWAN